MKKKIFRFLFMPYAPLLKMNFSNRVLFIPDLILGVISALVIWIINNYFSWGINLSQKLMLPLFFQVIYAILFQWEKHLDKPNLEAYEEFCYDRKIAVISFFTTLIVIIVLVLIHDYSLGESSNEGIFF